MALYLRVDSKAGFTTKGSALTWSEEDQTFIGLYDLIQTALAIDTASFAPYNSGTTYTNVDPDYVSYNGNIYECIVASTVGNNPSDATKWTLVSVGEFTHVKDRDLYLDFGGANQVAASALYRVLNVTQVTAANFAGFAAAGTLNKNSYYEITDDATLQVFVKTGLTGFDYSTNAILRVRMPDATVAATWTPGGSIALNVRRSWDNLVYNHITTTNTTTSPDADATNWQVVITSNTTYYKSVYYSAKIKFSGTAFTVLQATDPKTGDVYGTVTAINRLINSAYGSDVSSVNECDAGSYIICPNVSNSVHIRGNKIKAGSNITVEDLITGLLQYNRLEYASLTIGNAFDGSFAGNKVTGCQLTIPASSTASVTDTIIEFGDPVDITIDLRADAILDANTINKHGSDVSDTIDMTGRTTLDCQDNGVDNKYIGVYLLDSSNGTETVDTITGLSPYFPSKIVGGVGTAWTIEIVDGASVTGDGQIVGDVGTLNGASIPIYGNGVSCIIVDPVTIDGFNVAQIKHYQP